MAALRFTSLISADRKTVWETMLGDVTYRQWTAAFQEGSYFEGSWEKGARIRFLGPGGEGGMTAVIAENRPHEYVSIKHLGIVKNGVDVTEGDEVAGWAPAFENYTFERSGTSTALTVEVEVPAAYEEYMKAAWIKALDKLKSLCEAK